MQQKNGFSFLFIRSSYIKLIQTYIKSEMMIN